MYLEHFQLHTSPFREELDPEIFFPEAGRDAICRGLQRDLEEGRLFVKLIGTEGTGKTLLCKVLFEELSDAVEVVYIDNPKGSFDDVLRVVCLDLGLQQAVDEQVNLVEELKKQLQRRKKHGHRVVLVLDGAENIFLATLERLLRLLCELEEPTNFTLLLAGRPALDANLEQLTVYCTGVDIDAGYRLEPMSSKETGRYLTFRLLAAGLDKDKQQEVFTGEAVEKIYAKASGNPRLTNILAEEALQRSCSEKSFMVLLDHVDSNGDPVKTQRKENDLLETLQGKKKILGICAGAAVLLLVLFFLLPGKEQVKEQAVPKGISSPAGESVAVQSPALEPESVKETVDTPLQPSGPKMDSNASSPVVDKPASADEKVPVAEDSAQVQKEKPAARNGEELFQERLRASAGWLVGSYRGQYTIQLMMLSSDQAPANVKKLFVQDEYFSIIDKLYILRKKTNPPTLFVFYGTFATMDDARQARNQMPIFLRKHHPYALSIADALTKTED